MDTQKILKPVGKITIIADYREKEVIERLEKIGAVVNKQPLEIGDFIVSDKIVFERKTHSDFVSSIIDGRLFEQVYNMKNNFEKTILIVEGSSNREINENAFRAALASVVVNDGVSILNTKNPEDTAKTIFWIAKKDQEEKKSDVVFKVGKKPLDENRLKEMIVASLPGVSNVISKRLLEHFGSVEKIFLASEGELKKVKGVGDKLAKNIRKLVTSNY